MVEASRGCGLTPEPGMDYCVDSALCLHIFESEAISSQLSCVPNLATDASGK